MEVPKQPAHGFGDHIFQSENLRLSSVPSRMQDLEPPASVGVETEDLQEES